MRIKRIIKIIFVIIIIVGIYYGIKISITNSNPVKSKEKILSAAFKEIQTIEVDALNVYTYGKSINVSGIMTNLYKENFENAKLIIRDGYEYEKSYNLNYSLDKKNKTLTFSTDNNMNRGVIIDDMPVGEYYFLIRIKTNNSIDPKFYSLKPTEKMKDGLNIDYYTVTDEGTNKKLTLQFNNMKYQDKDLNYLSMKIENSELPEDVYDIVIDAGHGGSDVGEKVGNITEAGVALEYAEKIKTKLEEVGFKVKLTRDRNNSDSFNYTDMYADDGRITIANESKAKLMISLHVNNDVNSGLRGLEVYAPPKSNIDFAKVLAKNIVDESGLEFSNNNSFKKSDGVYVKNYTANMIKSASDTAKSKGYEPYNITEDTPYMYTIREVGGVATNAYADGRNTLYDANKYYDSCQGIECYQVELGYIKNDIDTIQSDMDKIVDSIVKSIKENY